MIFISKYDSPLGMLTLASDGDALCGVWFDAQKHFAEGVPGPWTEKEVPVLAQTRHWLELYFSGQVPEDLPPLRPVGSEFAKAVWALLLTVPYGQTVTYGQLARQLGCRSAQAVGGAVGRNPISILVPCHRVVGSNGSLTGYAGGLARKQALLALEADGCRTGEKLENPIDFPGR